MENLDRSKSARGKDAWTEDNSVSFQIESNSGVHDSRCSVAVVTH